MRTEVIEVGMVEDMVGVVAILPLALPPSPPPSPPSTLSPFEAVVLIQAHARGFVARQVINGTAVLIHDESRNLLVYGPYFSWADPVTRLWASFPGIALALFLYQALCRSLCFTMHARAVLGRWWPCPIIIIQRSWRGRQGRWFALRERRIAWFMMVERGHVHPAGRIQAVWRGWLQRRRMAVPRRCGCPCAARNGEQCSNILPVGVDCRTVLCRPHRRLEDGTCDCPCSACHPELHGDQVWRHLCHDAGDDNMPDARSLGAGRKRKTRFQPRRGGGGGAGGSMARMLTMFLGLFTVAEAVGGHPSEHGGFLPGRSDMAVGNARTDLYTGLPGDLVTWLDDHLDNRLSASSMRTVSRAVDLWDEARERHGWPQVIMTDDAERGAKLVAYVQHLMRDTELVFSSICNYLWGLRHWMRLQHQADPAVGVIGYLDFIKSIKVPTFALGEPRRRVPRRVLKRILETCDLSDFVQVQACFIFLVLWFLHSRTEPFPKNHTGEESFDPKKHWLARDFTVRTFPFGFLFGVRQKAIKQDPRIERE